MANNNDNTFKDSMIKVCPKVANPDDIIFNKGIKIHFPPSKNHSALDFAEIDFDFTTYLSGFETTVQSALIDVGTRRGTNTYYPDRGNDFEVEAAQGYFIETTTLQHAANFLALDTRSFINRNINSIKDQSTAIITDTELQQKYVDNNPIIQTLTLVPSQIGPATVVLQSEFESENGEQIGQELETVI
jgi:hypothetical protein